MAACGAFTRARTPCRAPAMANGRCRMHGGTSPGPPKGNRNAWKHGRYARETALMRALLRDLRRGGQDGGGQKLADGGRRHPALPRLQSLIQFFQGRRPDR